LNGPALGILALAILCSAILPASAQTDGDPVRNALVVIADRDSEELHRLLDAGGSPSNVDKMLGAAQSLIPASAYRAPTGADGSFNFQDPIAAGTYNASVFAPGYVMGGNAPTISIDGAGSPVNVTVFMQPSAVLSGRVTDSEGKPIPGIIVAVGSRHSTNYDVTMDDGLFVLDTGLKTGSHEVHAFKPALADVSEFVDNFKEINLPIESRVAPFIKEQDKGYISFSSTVDLEQGKLTMLNIELDDSNVLSGKVGDSAGKPVQGVAVLAFSQDSDEVRSIAVTDENGNYSLANDLASGQHNIIVPSLFGKGYSAFRTSVSVPAASELDIVLQNSTTIGGRVIDANGNPVAGAKISAIDKQSAQSDNIQDFLAGSIAETTSGTDGSFEITKGLANGTYIATASFGDVPVASSVELSSGTSAAQIELGFTDVISIRGAVRDPAGIPIENASIAPGFASVFASADSLSVRSGPGGEFVLTAPTNGSTDESLYEELTVSAPSYETTVAQVTQVMNITLDKIVSTSISGKVISQKSSQPPVEIALSRQGTLVLAHNGTDYEIGIRTNSRVLDASLDQPAKRIDIELEGVQGSAGSSELVVPKDFLGGPFALSLDGEISRDFTISENQTHSVIGVTHDHALRDMALQGTTVVPDFPVAVVAAALAMATALAYRRLRPS
jgi:protocatechuate 3,4-dioxygenase beta subunit